MEHRLIAPLLGAALALTAFAAPAADAQGATLLHTMFQDHAVLQRGQPIRLYGRATPGEAVKLTFAGKRAMARADADGRWTATLPALKAGGPYTLTASATGTTQTVSDVLVGDVWLCSGQSNMELQVWRSLDARAEISGASSDTIRLLTVPQDGAVTPQETFQRPVTWNKLDSDSVRDFSAACYYYARELQKTVNVPMGLINAAWGGSRIQAWTSGPALRATNLYKDELDVLAQYATDPVGAIGRWGDVWARWWNARPDAKPGDTPWSATYVPGKDWRTAPHDLGPWEKWGVPELAQFDGMLWYRTTVKLTAQQASQDAVLALGPADEVDMTWVNGVAVGSTYGAGSGREYVLPRGLLKEGENSVVLNVLDTYRDGGLAGPASAHALRFKDGTSVVLSNPWKWRAVQGTDWPPRAPWQTAAGLSTLYNGMIAPLGRYNLRGMLWYQGESNTFEAERYRDLLRVLRADWRDRFGQDTPFTIVQLAGYGQPKSAPGESGWAALRESQRTVANDDANTGLAVAIDIGDHYDIHPSNKQELGRRLARVARHVVYGEKIAPSGPVPTAVKRVDDGIVVTFADVTGDLVAQGSYGPIGFELCGAAKDSCRYADAKAWGNAVALRAPNAHEATRVRYCWADGPVCTLFDGANLPAGPFELSIPTASSDDHAR
ncbi:sialate O-acetylesterase [Lysobacter sp. LF1]|uniref:Sialate O-acetylesterase n=1 Tax=Lysobacter stagni TaxID=3045172 RepID=A0ABT6XE68_9GAMM|nr:sialate O-acetylesterase [Lysobacter sp. LF1]MDI9238435.1 sialate O-acetylesterase [Lysobacter sp. LF1]